MIRNSISFHSQERSSCRSTSRIAAARGNSVTGDGDTVPDGGEVSRPEKTSTMSERLGARLFDISGKKLPLIGVTEKAHDRDSM